MRPNVIADYRAPWHAGLGLRMENDPTNIEPIYHPIFHPPVKAPPLKVTTKTPPVLDTRARKPVPVFHSTLTPPVQKPPVVTTCPTGFAWNGTQCIPSGTMCQPPMVQDAAGNCALPTGTQCPTGWTVDAAGGCTADERNPYSLYLPDTSAGAAGQAGGAGATPTLATCPSGQFDAAGNCIPPSIWQWLQESTLVPGVENLYVAGGGLLAGYLLFFHKSGGRK